MRKEKNLKKEIEKHLYMILNLAGVKKSIANEIVPVGVERIIDDVVREAFERFIGETGGEKVKVKEELYITDWGKGFGAGWNGAVMYQRQKQAKWLKNNL